jgi:hypothetical protein
MAVAAIQMQGSEIKALRQRSTRYGTDGSTEEGSPFAISDSIADLCSLADGVTTQLALGTCIV